MSRLSFRIFCTLFRETCACFALLRYELKTMFCPCFKAFEWKRLCSSWIIHWFYMFLVAINLHLHQWDTLNSVWRALFTMSLATAMSFRSCRETHKITVLEPEICCTFLSSSSVKSKITWHLAPTDTKSFSQRPLAVPSLCLIISIDIQIGIVQVLVLKTAKILQKYCKDTADLQ